MSRDISATLGLRFQIAKLVLAFLLSFEIFLRKLVKRETDFQRNGAGQIRQSLMHLIHSDLKEGVNFSLKQLESSYEMESRRQDVSRNWSDKLPDPIRLHALASDSLP